MSGRTRKLYIDKELEVTIRRVSNWFHLFLVLLVVVIAANNAIRIPIMIDGVDRSQEICFGIMGIWVISLFRQAEKADEETGRRKMAEKEVRVAENERQQRLDLQNNISSQMYNLLENTNWGSGPVFAKKALSNKLGKTSHVKAEGVNVTLGGSLQKIHLVTIDINLETGWIMIFFPHLEKPMQVRKYTSIDIQEMKGDLVDGM